MNETVRLADGTGDRPIGRGDALMLLLWAVAIPSLVGAVFAAALIASMAASTPFDQMFDRLQTNFYYVVGATTVGDAIVLWVIWRRAKTITSRPFMRFFSPVRLRTLLWAAVSAIALSIATLAVEVVLKKVYGLSLSPGQTETAMLPKTTTQLALLVAAFVVFVPFYEEVLFRGFLLGWLKRVAPVWLAIPASAAIFALFHGLYFTRETVSGIVGTGEIFAAGVLLAWWAARTKSLWPAYAVHVAGNATAFALTLLLPGWP